MAKYELRTKARNLRAKGDSVKDIAQKLGLSKSTVSIWVRDIILSVEQLERLRQKMIKGSERGRLKGALMQKHRRLAIIENYKKEGRERLNRLTDNEIFIAGIALYWAEGSKKYREFSFCNSDPALINFMLLWLKKHFNVKNDQIKVVIGINESHKDREEAVKKYWSEITGLPMENFRKTSFKKSKLKKVYENHNEHYGTLGVKVLKGSDLYYKILGLIDGLAISQRSSVG